jgi:hypothetical protein
MRRRKDMITTVVSFFLVTGMIGIGVLFARVLCKIDMEKGETWPEDFDGRALFAPVQKTTRRFPKSKIS